MEDPQFESKMLAIIAILDTIDNWVETGNILYFGENGRNLSIVEQ